MPAVGDLAQFVLSGLTLGSLYALGGLGIVVVANVTGVFNFAQGEYAMLAGMMVAWADRLGWGWAAGVPLAVATVVAAAVLQERATVAPARGRAGPLAMAVGTLGYGAILRGLALLVWKEDPVRAPSFRPGTFGVLGARLDNQAVVVWAVLLVTLAGTAALFRWTAVGRAMRASAINPTAARLVGIRLSPLSMGAFGLAGALAGLGGAATVPITLVSWNSGIAWGLLAFIAAAMGEFRYPSRAVLAGLGLGMVETLSAGLLSSTYRQVFVFGALLVYLFLRDVLHEEGVVRRVIRVQFGYLWRRRGPTRPVPVAEQPVVEEEVTPRAGKAGEGWLRPFLVAATLLLIPVFLTGPRERDVAIFIVLTAIGATGLGLVMGLAGQLSLGHAAFYLVSGYAAAILSGRYGWSVALAMLFGVALSVVLATGAGWLTLRLRGFNLAIATLAIHLILLVLVTQLVTVTGGPIGVTGVPPLRILGIDLATPQRFFPFAVTILAGCLLVAKALTGSAVGRALRAVGTDEDAAATLGLRTLRLKMLVFVVGGAMAGLAGALWSSYVRFAAPSMWDVKLAIDLVTVVVVGGVGSIYGGAVGAAVVGTLQFAIQETVFGGLASEEAEIMLSGLLLILFVLLFPDGLAGSSLAARGRQWLQGRLRRSGIDRGPVAVSPVALEARKGGRPARSSGAAGAAGADSGANGLLALSGLVKRFGGFTAVDGLDLTLRQGEILALVGPNGAGKTTVINLVSGFLVPSRGRIFLAGRRIDGVPPHDVARLGVGRTFQTPRLFAGMSTLETVMLGTERGSWSRGSRRAALTWLGFVGLPVSCAETPAMALPVGQQRLAELARALATEPEVVLLDEPAAGLDRAETSELGGVLREIRDMGLGVLLVEHDMDLVMSVADRVVVMDRGRKIAEGAPGDVARERTVIEAYLGVGTA